MQLCSEEIWKGVMSQIDTLGIAPEDLPEEALTQIYQVSLPLFKLSAAYFMFTTMCDIGKATALIMLFCAPLHDK